MSEYVVRADTTNPADLTGTAFAHLDVRVLVGAERNGSELTNVGQTVYPKNGGTHEAHSHSRAEETVIVLSGRGQHRIGERTYEIGPGDIVFVPRGVVHSAQAFGPQDMVILWVLGGAASLEAAGYEPAEETAIKGS